MGRRQRAKLRGALREELSLLGAKTLFAFLKMVAMLSLHLCFLSVLRSQVIP